MITTEEKAVSGVTLAEILYGRIATLGEAQAMAAELIRLRKRGCQAEAKDARIAELEAENKRLKAVAGCPSATVVSLQRLQRALSTKKQSCRTVGRPKAKRWNASRPPPASPIPAPTREAVVQGEGLYLCRLGLLCSVSLSTSSDLWSGVPVSLDLDLEFQQEEKSMNQLSATAAAIFTLITVNHNAEVGTTGFPTERLCREARSMILYGKTIEAKAAEDEATRKREEKDEAERKALKAEWLRSHPDRDATEAELRRHCGSNWFGRPNHCDAVFGLPALSGTGWSAFAAGATGHLTPDGRVHFEYQVMGPWYATSSFVIDETETGKTVKYAECFGGKPEDPR